MQKSPFKLLSIVKDFFLKTFSEISARAFVFIFLVAFDFAIPIPSPSHWLLDIFIWCFFSFSAFSSLMLVLCECVNLFKAAASQSWSPFIELSGAWHQFLGRNSSWLLLAITSLFRNNLLRDSGILEIVLKVMCLSICLDWHFPHAI